MRLLLIGVTGNLGQRVALRALADAKPGAVTVLVRSRDKLAPLIPAELLSKAQVVEADVLDAAALRQAMAGHTHCISTAGNAKEPAPFQAIFEAVVDAAVASLTAPKRLWMLAGATVTDIPGAQPGYTMNDLPIFSLLPFMVHTANLKHLAETGSSLDWTLMCPGVLHPASEADSRRPPAELFVRTAPLWVPSWQLWDCSPRLLLVGTILPQMGSFAVSLEEVAQAMLDNLEPGTALSRQKVGLIKAASGPIKAE